MPDQPAGARSAVVRLDSDMVEGAVLAHIVSLHPVQTAAASRFPQHRVPCHRPN